MLCTVTSDSSQPIASRLPQSETECTVPLTGSVCSVSPVVALTTCTTRDVPAKAQRDSESATV